MKTKKHNARKIINELNCLLILFYSIVFLHPFHFFIKQNLLAETKNSTYKIYWLSFPPFLYILQPDFLKKKKGRKNKEKENLSAVHCFCTHASKFLKNYKTKTYKKTKSEENKKRGKGFDLLSNSQHFSLSFPFSFLLLSILCDPISEEQGPCYRAF